MMRNAYEVRGKVTAIMLKRRSGEVFETLINTEDLEKILKIDCTWYANPTRDKRVFYAHSGKVGTHGKRKYLHRVITNAPKGLVVDHLDHNTLNNKKNNLKVVTNSENVSRQKRHSGKSYSGGGLHWHKRDKRWIARIQHNKRRKWLGSFKEKSEAEEAIKRHIRKMSPRQN